MISPPESKENYSWEHQPVALDTILNLIQPVLTDNEKLFFGVDSTFGMGGHSGKILQNFPNVNILGIDRDVSAIKQGKEKFLSSKDRIDFFYGTYDEIKIAVQNSKFSTKPDFILMDLGVSSPQLDNPERGFSYSKNAPLDMRMDENSELNAEYIINNYSVEKLSEIFRKYGQEKFSKTIARNIDKRRKFKKIYFTDELVEIIYDSIPAPARRHGGHPAKRVFQALRVEVNDELAILDKSLKNSIEILNPGGRLIVMSYQSDEDKIVKSFFDSISEINDNKDFPIPTNNSENLFQIVKPKLIKASEEEVNKNSRAKSVRIRTISKRKTK